MLSIKCYLAGDYTLDIDPVLLEDDAVFQCQVGAADGVDPIRSRDATLTVNVPPEPPMIINGDVLSTNEDREVEIKCVSRGGKPVPTVSLLKYAPFTVFKTYQKSLSLMSNGHFSKT